MLGDGRLALKRVLVKGVFVFSLVTKLTITVLLVPFDCGPGTGRGRNEGLKAKVVTNATTMSILLIFTICCFAGLSQGLADL